MKKLSLILTCLLVSLSLPLLSRSEQEEIKLIARIKSSGQKIELVKGHQTAAVKTKLSSPELQKVIQSLEPGDEALITGHLRYEAKGVEAETTPPVFVIETIRPISLKRLGKMNREFIEDPRQFVITPAQVAAPKTIPVTGDVANAITMTASLLLLQNLSTPEGTSPIQKDLNTGLIFSAGALATGLFIYEQITGKTKSN